MKLSVNANVVMGLVAVNSRVLQPVYHLLTLPVSICTKLDAG